MVVLSIRFLTGRFHATPWGRNVNEGEPEWPPSPYRIARALISSWKMRHPELSAERMGTLMVIFNEPARFRLPPASTGHTRSYLSSNKKDPSAKQRIFDAFTVVDPVAWTHVGFDADLSEPALSDLAMLLKGIHYLGRSESWVDMRLTVEPPGEWNCVPLAPGDTRQGVEPVRVAAVLSEDGYAGLAHRPPHLEWKNGKLKKSKAARPWLDALCMGTDELIKDGWNRPPALKWETYGRPLDALTPRIASMPMPAPEYRCITYRLTSRVMPRIEETVSVAERARAKLMGIHKRVKNGDGEHVSRLFSGKDASGRPMEGHEHAFYWPMDTDRDGRLDALVVHAPAAFDTDELKALDFLRSMWQPNRRPDIHLVLTRTDAAMPAASAQTWVSATPFITTRHYKKKYGSLGDWLKSEIGRECGFHGLPEPSSVAFTDRRLLRGRAVRWAEFLRNRKGKRPMSGYGCVLEFDAPVRGPFALGALCHFGLGVFEPLGG